MADEEGAFADNGATLAWLFASAVRRFQRDLHGAAAQLSKWAPTTHWRGAGGAALGREAGCAALHWPELEELHGIEPAAPSGAAGWVTSHNLEIAGRPR